MLNVAKSFLL